jgi:hypothetical protein
MSADNTHSHRISTPEKHSTSGVSKLVDPLGSPLESPLPASSSSMILNVDLNRDLPLPPPDAESDAEQSTIAKETPPDLFQSQSPLHQLPDLFQSRVDLSDASPASLAASTSDTNTSPQHKRSHDIFITPSKLDVLSQVREPELYISGLTNERLFAKLPPVRAWRR